MVKSICRKLVHLYHVVQPNSIFSSVYNNLFSGKLGAQHFSWLIFRFTQKCSFNAHLCISYILVFISSIILGPVECRNKPFPMFSGPISIASKQFSNLSSHLSQELAAVQA